jgi:hypothetical protein
MEGKKDYKCDVCNKFYKNYKSLWKHNYIFHKQNVIINDDIVTNNVTKITTNLNCNYCNKLLASRQSKNRHENHYCKEKNKINIINKIENQDNKIEILIETVNKLKKENELIKKMKTNKSNTKINTQNNNNNNGIINNIHINALGHESIIAKLTEKEKIDLLTCSLFKETPHIELIRKIYNNDKFMEDRNTMITNLQTKSCLAYNNKTKKFEAKNKKDHIDSLIDYRQQDIKDLFEDMQDNKKIKPHHKQIIETYIDNIDDIKKSETYKKNKEEIIYIIYNCKEIMKNLKEKLDEADALETLEGSDEDKNLVV